MATPDFKETMNFLFSEGEVISELDKDELIERLLDNLSADDFSKNHNDFWWTLEAIGEDVVEGVAFNKTANRFRKALSSDGKKPLPATLFGKYRFFPFKKEVPTQDISRDFNLYDGVMGAFMFYEQNDNFDLLRANLHALFQQYTHRTIIAKTVLSKEVFTNSKK